MFDSDLKEAGVMNCYGKERHDGFKAASKLWFAVVVLVFLAVSCAHPQYIPDPVSMAMWTDAPGEPDPLEACHRVTGPGACVVSSARAWAWWMAKWAEREERLEAGEGEE